MDPVASEWPEGEAYVALLRAQPDTRAGRVAGISRALSVLVLAWLVAGSPAPARAQDEPVPCPVDESAGSAAEQALCWFELHEETAPHCAQQRDPETREIRSFRGRADDCIAQTVRWCRKAALDDPRVAEVCFLAPLRDGRMEEALAASEYVRDPSAETRRCVEVLTRAVSLHVTTNPAGAEVHVGSRNYGPAPVDITLAPPWWARNIVVRFGESEVRVSQRELVASFHAPSCEMVDLVVQGPERSTEAERAPDEATQASRPSEAEPQAAGGGLTAPGTGEDPEDEPRDGRPVWGWVAGTAGVAVAAGGVALLAVAQSTANDLRDDEPGSKSWPKAEPDYDSIRPQRIAGSILLVVGGAAALTGILVLTLDGSEDEAGSGLALALSPSGARLEWSY